MNHILLHDTTANTVIHCAENKRVCMMICKTWNTIVQNMIIQLPNISCKMPHYLVPYNEKYFGHSALAAYLRFLPGKLCKEIIVNHNNSCNYHYNDNQTFCHDVLIHYRVCNEILTILFKSFTRRYFELAVHLYNPPIDFLVDYINQNYYWSEVYEIQWPNQDIYAALLPFYLDHSHYHLNHAIDDILFKYSRKRIIFETCENWMTAYLPFIKKDIKYSISTIPLSIKFVMTNFQYLNITTIIDYNYCNIRDILADYIGIEKMCCYHLSESYLYKNLSKFDLKCWNLISQHSHLSAEFINHPYTCVNLEIYRRFHH